MNNTDTEISSITVGPRQSNIEILRIVAMFLVLVVHATFYSTGVTTAEDFACNPVSSFTKVSIRSLSIVCVNVFVLISGWFGIRAGVKGLANFAFQCAFLIFGIYAVMLAAGAASFSFRELAACMCLSDDYWFIPAYVGLYILSPALNLLAENTSRRKIKYILIAFFTFQTIWGWIGNVRYIADGYSCFSFAGLYLLARYVRLYGGSRVKACGGLMYIGAAVINTLLYYATCMLGIPVDIYSYASPIVITGSLGLLLFFDRLKIKPDKTVNRIARSAFAVYLLHCNPAVMAPVFKRYIMGIYEKTSGIECLGGILLFLMAVFCLSILIDQPRRWCWDLVSRHWPKELRRQ